jgi:hypothetical protein
MPTRRMTLIATAALVGGTPTLWAQPRTEPWPEVRAALAQATLLGSARLRFWGFDVYDAQLWATPGFQANQYLQQPFGLTLNYLRALKGGAIAERSLKEMQDIALLDQAQATPWLQAMTQLFPDVRAGDRITGLHQPGHGARFWLNGQPLGQVADERFSQRFSGIWLHPGTSQPAMRRDLLAGAAQ